MRPVHTLALSAVLALAWGGGFAHADPVTGNSIPENARWVIHLDLDAAKATPLLHTRKRGINGQVPEVREKIKLIEGMTGVNLERDLHDATLFGTGFDEESACFLIHAKFDQEKTTAFLKLNDEFNTLDHNGQTIMSWRDKGHDRIMYGAFAKNDVAILGPSLQLVRSVLDTQSGKSAGLKATSPLVPPAAKPGVAQTPVIWIAGRGLTDLPRVQKVESPPLGNMEDASLGIIVTNDNINARVTATANSEKEAQLMSDFVIGTRAGLSLASTAEHAPPMVKMVASALQSLTVSREGKVITAEWSITLDKFGALVDAIQPGPAANMTEGTSLPPVNVQPK